MNSDTIIVIMFGILTLIILIVLHYTNQMSDYKSRIDHQLKSVAGYLNDIYSVIEDIKIFIENNLEHEEEYIKKLKHAQLVFDELAPTKESFQKLKQAEKDFLQFNTFEEVYPNLKKNRKYLELKEVVMINKDRLNYALDSYDKEVTSYNNYQQKKIVILLSKAFHFSKYDCYNK